MNTIWLKIAAAAVGVVVVVIVVSKFTSNDAAPTSPPQSQEPGGPKTVYDSFERDDREFGVSEPTDSGTADTTTPPAAATTPQETAPAEPTPPTLTQADEPTFEKLPIEEDIQAQRLHSMALEERKRSRLPMMTPKLMVDYCREIIQRWPKSEYAFQAKRMLADIPERYKEMYKVTDQETDVSSFYK